MTFDLLQSKQEDLKERAKRLLEQARKEAAIKRATLKRGQAQPDAETTQVGYNQATSVFTIHSITFLKKAFRKIER